eukprot:gene30233-36537_t
MAFFKTPLLRNLLLFLAIEMEPSPPDAHLTAILPAAPAVVDETVEFYEVIEKNFLISKMKLLKDDNRPRNPKKPGEYLKVPDCYKDFNKMSANQKDNLRILWTLLKKSIRHGLNAAFIQHSVNSGAAPEDGNNKQRAENTTMNDRIRLLELRYEPAAQMHWQSALNPRATREELDAAHSHESEERDRAMNGYAALADMFNNRNEDSEAVANPFQPKNRALKYENGTIATPLKEAEPRFATVYGIFKDVDPNQRQAAIRDAPWVKKTWSDLKKDISNVWSKFTKSGTHNGDLSVKDAIEEWITNFANLYTIPVKYVALFADWDFCDSLGGQLPQSAQVTETPIVGSSSKPSSVQSPVESMNLQQLVRNKRTLQRQAQRRRKKQRKEGGGGDGGYEDDDSSASGEEQQQLATALQHSIDQANERSVALEALKYVADPTVGFSKKKQDKARSRILALAGISAADDDSSSSGE